MLGMAQLATQLAAQPQPPEVRQFQPLSFPGQLRPVTAPPRPLLSQKDWYYLMLIVSLIAIWGSTIMVFWKIPFILARALVVVGALGATALVGFVLLFSIGITPTTDDSQSGIARSSLLELGKSIQMPIEVSPFIVEDDECRVGMLVGQEAIAIADYTENRGLLVPFTRLDSIASYEGVASALPPLPEPAADRWIIETEQARKSNDTTRLYQIELRFRDLNPGIIAVRYVIPDYFMEVSTLAGTCRHRMQPNAASRD
jgi:hypothetical protein